MADNRKYVQAQRFRLSGSGVSSTATSLSLQSFKVNGVALAMTDFGTLGYLVLEPGTSREETVSFTGVTQNGDGTATLTGLTRGLGFKAPYTADSANQRAHGGGSIAILSDPAAWYDGFLNKNNDETIEGAYTFNAVPSATADPVSGDDLARRSWILNNLPGGTVSVDALIVAAQAGETVSAGQLVYFDTTDDEWKLCDADNAATLENVMLGIAQGAGTNGNAIAGGVLLRGVDKNQSGLVQGNIMYASNTAGGISTSAGTTPKAIGIARTATNLYFDPAFFYILTANQKAALAGSSGTPSDTNRFVTQNDRAFSPTGAMVQFAGSSAPTGWLICDGAAVSRTTYAALFAAIGTTFGAGDGTTTFNIPDGRGRTAIGAGTGTKVFTFSSRSSNTITVTGSSNSSTNEIQTGQAILYSAPSGAMTGLTHNTTYYLIRIAFNQFQLATSVANANAGTAISLSSDGTGAQTFTITLSARAVGETGGDELHSLSDSELPSHDHALQRQTSSGGSTQNNVSVLNHGGVWGTSSPSYDYQKTATNGNSQQLVQDAGSDSPHNNMQPFFAGHWIIKT